MRRISNEGMSMLTSMHLSMSTWMLSFMSPMSAMISLIGTSWIRPIGENQQMEWFWMKNHEILMENVNQNECFFNGNSCDVHWETIGKAQKEFNPSWVPWSYQALWHQQWSLWAAGWLWGWAQWHLWHWWGWLLFWLGLGWIKPNYQQAWWASHQLERKNHVSIGRNWNTILIIYSISKSNN